MEVSIITIVKNDIAGIRKTLSNIHRQTYTDFQHVIIDGASTDGTVDVIRNEIHSGDVFISEADSGIADAFNKGIHIAAGSWLIFMNAGDTFIDNTSLEKLVTIGKKNEQYSIITGYAINSRAKFRYPLRPLSNTMHVFEKARLAHQATLIKKSAFSKYGLYSSRFSITMDYEFFIRVLKHEQVLFIEKAFCYYDVSGVSSQYFKTALETIKAQFYAAENFIDILMSIYFIIKFPIIKLRHKCIPFYTEL